MSTGRCAEVAGERQKGCGGAEVWRALTGKTTNEPRTQTVNDRRHRSSSFAAGSMNVNATAHCRARPPMMSA